MIINWFGQSCFKIQGDTTTLVTDPFDASYGLKVPRLAAHVVTVSHDHHDHNNSAAVKPIGERPTFVVTQPGEYEISNTFIYGIPSFHDAVGGKERGQNIIYRIEIDGVTIVHLGDLGHALDNALIEQLEGVDILLIPVGGTYTIDSKQALAIVSQLEPRIVIPMHYQIPGLKLKNKIDDLQSFCKQIGICQPPVDKLKIAKKDLPQDDVQVVTLQP